MQKCLVLGGKLTLESCSVSNDSLPKLPKSPCLHPDPPALTLHPNPCLSMLILKGIFFKLIFIGVQLIYNVVLVSGVQQSESAISTHISILLDFFFPYKSLQSIE